MKYAAESLKYFLQCDRIFYHHGVKIKWGDCSPHRAFASFCFYLPPSTSPSTSEISYSPSVLPVDCEKRVATTV
jgi:hypothetical protein